MMLERFPVLTSIAAILRFLGYLTAVAGAFLAVTSPFTAGNTFLGDMRIAGVVLGIAVVVVGLAVVALSESIWVLFAIEDNTRRAATQLTQKPTQTEPQAAEQPIPGGSDDLIKLWNQPGKG